MRFIFSQTSSENVVFAKPSWKQRFWFLRSLRIVQEYFVTFAKYLSRTVSKLTEVRKQFMNRLRNDRPNFSKLSESVWGFTKILRTSRTLWVGCAHIIWQSLLDIFESSSRPDMRETFARNFKLFWNSCRTNNYSLQQLMTLPNPAHVWQTFGA